MSNPSNPFGPDEEPGVGQPDAASRQQGQPHNQQPGDQGHRDPYDPGLAGPYDPGHGQNTVPPAYRPYGQPYPQAPVPPPGYPMVSPYPGAGARLGALVLDYLVVGVIVCVVGSVIVWNDVMNWIDAIDRWDGYGDAPDLALGKFYLVGLLGIVIWYIYRIGMESTKGQTLGKMALKMKVVDVDGQLPTVQASFLRNTWYLISSLLSFIPVLGWFATIGVPVAVAVTISNSPYRQSFTDSWAKTYVVSTRPVL